METEEDFDPFPFNMCDFVTVDEVGDVADLPLPLPLPPSPTTAVETPQEDPPAPEPKDPQTVLRSAGTRPMRARLLVRMLQWVSHFQGDAVGATVDPDNRTAEREHTPPVQASPRDSEPTVEPPSPPAETGAAACGQSPSVGGGRHFPLTSAQKIKPLRNPVLAEVNVLEKGNAPPTAQPLEEKLSRTRK